MQNTVRIEVSDEGLELRLQAPSLTNGENHVTAAASVNENAVEWKAVSKDIRLYGRCMKENGNLWMGEFIVRNDGPDAEVRIALPYLFYHFEQEQPARIFNPLFGGVLEVCRSPLRISYPGPASFCMTAAAGLEKTVAIGLYNDEQRHVVIRHIPAGNDGQIRLVFERVAVKSNTELRLPAMFISLGNDWAAAMKPYKDWFANTFKRPRTRPAWWEAGNYSETRKAHCVVPYNPPKAGRGVWIFDNEGMSRTFEQVKAEVDEAAADGEEGGYLPLFYQFGWWKQMEDIKGLFMFDSVCGDYWEAHDLARKTIAYIHGRGLKTYLYTNVISAGDESEVYKNHPELFVRNASGFAVYNEAYPMMMFCPGAPGIREYWNRVLHHILIDLDADGIFLDQVAGGTAPHYCYAEEHKHEHPDTYGKSLLNLINHICDYARGLKPDCFIAGELMLDSRSILLDETHGIGYAEQKAPAPETLEEQRETPPSEYYVFTKYLCPGIYSGIAHSRRGLMNGGAGHHKDSVWREYRRIFESGCIPCTVSPRGGLAYLYGPVDGKAILAVCAHGEIGNVEIRLPPTLIADKQLPEGVGLSADGNLICRAGTEPGFYLLGCSYAAD